MCPENPNADKFKTGSDIVFSQLTMKALKKGETLSLTKGSVSSKFVQLFCSSNQIYHL